MCSQKNNWKAEEQKIGEMQNRFFCQLEKLKLTFLTDYLVFHEKILNKSFFTDQMDLYGKKQTWNLRNFWEKRKLSMAYFAAPETPSSAIKDLKDE